MRRNFENPRQGSVLIIDKPAGLSSAQVVGRVKKLLRAKKVGHAGTLDPMATGLLVVAVGPVTRRLTELYRAALVDPGQGYDLGLGV